MKYHGVVERCVPIIPEVLAVILLLSTVAHLVACGGGGGGSSTPTPTVTVSVSPSSVNLAVNNTQQFTATVTGSSNTAVTWSVNGTAGGNSTLGTISSGGLFTVPATVPNPSSVSVTATSVADTTKSGSAEVTIVAPAPPRGPQISSLSEIMGNPFDLLTITGSGFDSTAIVSFSSAASGFSANIQPVVVSQTSLVVSVPVLFKGAAFASGAVNVVVAQSSSQSNSMQLAVAGVPPAPPLAPGTITLGFLEGELAIANQLSSEATPNPLPSDLAALVSALNAVIPPIQSVVNGTASSANLGSLSGQPVILGAPELAQMDQLFLALLQSLANSSGSTSSSGVSSRRARLAQPSSTGCLSAPAIENTIYDVSVSGGGTAANIASDLVYLNQPIGTSLVAIEALELAPTAILVVAESGVLVVSPPLVLAAEIYEGLSDLIKVTQYIQNPAPTGADKAELLLTLIGNAGLGLAGDIATLWVGVGDLQRDYQNLPQGVRPNPQAAACVSALSLNFGVISLGMQSPPQSVTLTNSSASVPLTITHPLIVGGPNPADFQETDNCPGTLGTLSSCTVMVTFTPSMGGSEGAAVGISGTSPPLPIVIDLSGAGNLSGGTPDAVIPSISLGSVGGCAGGSLSGTISVTAAPGVTWTTSFYNFPNPPPSVTLNPASGTGSESVTVTITMPPQTPDPGFTCSDTFSLFWGYNYVDFSFSDGPVLATDVTFTTITVD